MSAIADYDTLDHLLDPVSDCFTPEVAAKIVALRASPEVQARLDQLAGKNAEGTITPDELDVYRTMVSAGNLIAVLQAKARAVLAGR